AAPDHEDIARDGTEGVQLTVDDRGSTEDERALVHTVHAPGPSARQDCGRQFAICVHLQIDKSIKPPMVAAAMERSLSGGRASCRCTSLGLDECSWQACTRQSPRCCPSDC